MMVAALLCLPLSSYGSLSSVDETLQQADAAMHALNYRNAYDLYRTVASKYRPDMPRAEKLQCLHGIYGCADAGLFLSDYTETFNNLLLAEEICETDGFDPVRFEIIYSSLFIALASQTGKTSYMQMALPHTRRSFAYAMQKDDMELIYRSFGDLSNIAFILKDFSLIDAEERKLSKKLADGNWLIRCSDLFYKARKEQTEGRLDRSLSYFDSCINTIPESVEFMRMKAAIYKDAALVIGRQHDLKKAMAYIDKSLALTYKYNFYDIRYGALIVLIIIDNDFAPVPGIEAVRTHCLELKDSLKTYRIADDVCRLETMRDHKEMQKQIAVSNYRNHMLVYMIAALLIVVIGVGLFLYTLHRKNKVLKYRARLLRQRMREMYENPTLLDAGKAAKYEKSALTQEDKAEIASRISQVLNSDDVFALDFSLNVLAERIDRHPKAVSQVIHEEFDTNFSTLVNRIRIVEACRRLDSDDYAKYSVDGIAESVGFNSRSAFDKNFKKFTGLGIREYRKKPSQSD